jgi:hypothetical protein
MPANGKTLSRTTKTAERSRSNETDESVSVPKRRRFFQGTSYAVGVRAIAGLELNLTAPSVANWLIRG